MGSTIGLLGRRGAYVQLDMAIALTRATGKRLLIALVDLDRFYRINEMKGTEFGNTVLDWAVNQLEVTAADLSEGMTPVVSRLEGNTFLATLQLKGTPDCCSYALEALKQAVERPVPDGERELYLTASIGACLYPQDGWSGEPLLCRAESALYRAKEGGGNRTMLYNEADAVRMNRRIAVETGLRPALFLRQFRLGYQPIYRLSDGRLKGFEALIRWNHPELGAVPPHEFIPIAEHNGLIVPIGEWVLREACKMMAGWHRCGLSELTMSINISPLQLLDPAFAGTVINTLQDCGLAPGAVELEITENVMIRSSDLSLETLSRLRAAGIRIALDDFGVGYASFSTLKQLPIHCLKIDKSFVGQIDLPSAERHIVESLIGLVHKLGAEVVAEGVEYEDQYRLLKEWGCDYAQGYLLGRPSEVTAMDMGTLRGHTLCRHTVAGAVGGVRAGI